MRTLPQRLLLISLDEDGKARDRNSSLANGLAGAALMELVLAGRLGRQDGRLVASGDSAPATSCSTSSWPRSAASSGPAGSSGG